VATQGTKKVWGGTPYRRYSNPPVVGIGNSLGLYPWSVFKAAVCDWNGDTAPVAQADLSSLGLIYLLLFTSDVPALLELRATDTGTNLQFSAGFVNDLSVGGRLVTTAGGSTPATIPTQGKVLAGYTGGAADVYCTGFPATGSVVAPGVSGTSTYTEAICVANGPVIASPVSSLSLAYDQGKAATFAPVPILIPFVQYTAAVRDAGNLITAPNGALYKVVGLWGH